MPQFFKGDADEIKMYTAFETILTDLSMQKTAFFDEAFTTFVLGDLLYDTGRAPLASAIPRPIFREAFSAIFEAFLSAGSFESYLVVFRKVFGEDVEVTFTVPAPGKLNIAIVASGIIISDLLARYIASEEYVFDEIVDEDGDNVSVQTIKGFETEYELNKMLFEMVPAGIYTTISLTVGGA